MVGYILYLCQYFYQSQSKTFYRSLFISIYRAKKPHHCQVKQLESHIAM